MNPGWHLLPLRLFLGVTFVYAGLQKLANPAFLDDSNPTSIHAQLSGAATTSPIHGMVAGLIHVAPLVGILIAFGELAIGVGTLLGLWTRVAALAGMAISLGLFLTVSFHSSPYFTGSDLVFFFGWTPLFLAGAGGGALDTRLVAPTVPVEHGVSAITRRTVMSKGVATGVVAVLVVLGGGVTALIGRLAGGSNRSSGVTPLPALAVAPTTSVASSATTSVASSPTTSIPAGTKLGSASKVPVGGSARFTDPRSGDPGLVIQRTSGHFVAFDAICPHTGCTVSYQPATNVIACPCHGSEFNAETGALERGPAYRGLSPIPITKDADGNLYVDG